MLRVTFIIECKVTKERPWVLFTAESVRLSDRARVVQRTASAVGDAFLHELSDSGTVQDLPFFVLPKRPGYGLVQALRKPDAKDLSYEALTSVSAALQHKLVKLTRLQKTAKVISSRSSFPSSLPMVGFSKPISTRKQASNSRRSRLALSCGAILQQGPSTASFES